MHVNRPPVDLGVADMYAAQAAKKAAEAKKAADVRRKLLRASASINGESSSFVSFVSSEGRDGGSQHGSEQDTSQSLAASVGRSAPPPKRAVEAAANPLSIWV